MSMKTTGRFIIFLIVVFTNVTAMAVPTQVTVMGACPGFQGLDLHQK
jgi:hypothetical protein